MPDANRRKLRKPTGRLPYTVYVRPTNWEWAQQQHSGGASPFIEAILTKVKKRDDNRKMKKEIERLRKEVARLTGLLLADGKDVSE